MDKYLEPESEKCKDLILCTSYNYNELGWKENETTAQETSTAGSFSTLTITIK